MTKKESPGAEIVNFQDLSGFLLPLKKRSIVLVGGCFDLLHFGHIQFLSNARQHGDHLMIALEPDFHIKNRKKREAVHTQYERALILSALRFVSSVVMLPDFQRHEQYHDLVNKVRPSVVAVTSDDPLMERKRSQVESIGGSLEVVTTRISRFSSSNILKQL